MLLALRRIVERPEGVDNAEHQDRTHLFYRADEAAEHLAELEELVEEQSDNELSLVLQALLDIHLRMAVDWMATVNDAVSLWFAASPDPLYATDSDVTPTGTQLHARQLVAVRQGIGVCGSIATTNGLIERELRKQWRGMCRNSRDSEVNHLAHLAACVAVERTKRQPRGIFSFLLE